MSEAAKTILGLADFPMQSHDKVRWSDIDSLRHVNNAVFVTYCETGRAELMREFRLSFLDADYTFFAARVAIDFRSQLSWPGTVEIGSGVKAFGRSSITFVQALFQNGKCAANAESVLVRVRADTGRPVPLDDDVRQHLERYLIP